MRSVGLAGLAVSIVLAAGCSGGDDDAAPSTTQEPPPTSPTTTESEVTTTTVVETTTTTTTVAETTTTTTVESTTSTTAASTSTTLPEGVPPRVTFPDDPEKQAVVDAAYAFFDAANAAQAAPENAELRAAVAEKMTEPMAGRFFSFLDELVDDGVRIVPSDAHPTYFEVLPFTVFAIDGAGIIDGCSVDGAVRVSADTGDVVSADTGSVFVTYSLTQQDDRWLVNGFTVVARYPGEVGCGDG